ncbi:MAG: peptidase S41 [Saprospiraceae bacterium]|nr:peptidase S41 [Saprospiraceae bacterium]
MKTIIISIMFLSALSAYSQVEIPNTISKSDKIYGLSKFWQEVNYNFIYLNKVDKKMWESAYKEYISKVYETKNDYEYYRELSKFCALLKDGHTNIYFPKNLQSLIMNTMFGEYRMFLKHVAGKVIIERVNESKKDEIPVGSEIIEVNGHNTIDFMNKFVKPYISSSTHYVLEDYAASQLLKGLEGDTFHIKIKTPRHNVKSFTLVHQTTKEDAVFPPFESDSLFVMKWMGRDILYLALNSFADNKINKDFEKNLPEIYKAKALIIDLRNNGGGNTGVGTGILQYLTNDAVLHHSRYRTREHRASFKAWGIYTTPKDTINNEWQTKCYLYNQDEKYYDFEYEPDTITIKEKRLVVPTTLLIGHNTASAAEDFLISADNQKHFTKIGENSFGSTGQPFLFEMPGGGNARVCTKKDTYPDGREFVGVGIKPDIEVIPTLNDYTNKKDVVLEKALDYLNKKLK